MDSGARVVVFYLDLLVVIVTPESKVILDWQVVVNESNRFTYPPMVRIQFSAVNRDR